MDEMNLRARRAIFTKRKGALRCTVSNSFISVTHEAFSGLLRTKRMIFRVMANGKGLGSPRNSFLILSVESIGSVG